MKNLNDWQWLDYAELSSTNDTAAELCVNPPASKFVVTCRSQTGGRGRRGRSWISLEGNLFMSQAFPCDIRFAGDLVFIISLSVLETVRYFSAQIDIKLKWPNDVLVKGKKICGILLETFSDFDKIHALVSGIGVNISNDVSAIENAINLVSVTGKNENGNEICADIVKEFFDYENILKRQGFEPIKEKYLLKSITIGKNAKISKNGEYIEGFAEGLDDNGFLVLKTSDGKTTVFSGDVV